MVHHSRGWKVQDQGTASDEGFLTASKMTEGITWLREGTKKRAENNYYFIRNSLVKSLSHSFSLHLIYFESHFLKILPFNTTVLKIKFPTHRFWGMFSDQSNLLLNLIYNMIV